MKRILVLVVLVLLVAGGGGGAAWWFLLREEPPPEMAVRTEPDAPTYIEFDPIVLPLIHEGQVTKHVTFRIVLEMNEADEDRVLLAKRQLTDAFIQELHGLLALRFVREMGDPSPLMQRRLLVASDRLLGAGVVDRVNVSEFGRRTPIRG
jgi:hypothetical protein